MSGFKQKFAGFMQKFANPQENNGRHTSKTSSSKSRSGGKSPKDRGSTSNDCFLHKYLNGAKELNNADEPKIIHGRFPRELPSRHLGAVSKTILAACTGPDGGLLTVNKKKRRHLSITDSDLRFIDTVDEDALNKEKDANSNTSTVNSNLLNEGGCPLSRCESTPTASELLRMSSSSFPSSTGELVAGVQDWDSPTDFAYGRSVSLYEKDLSSGLPAGEPIADCFAIVARPDSAILALADGVNWGFKASLAAKAAVHGCVDYLNQALYHQPTHLSTTMEAFVALLRSFHSAHNLILEENGLLTTLTAVIVIPLPPTPSTSPNSDSSFQKKFIACACNVGDSLAYVFSHRYGVREITQGSHDLSRMRDMRDALGALGPVDGINPELANLTCAMTEVEPGDIVFITSDGVSDNLDPVVGKFTGVNGVEAEQRHRLGLLRIEDLLRNGVSGNGPAVTTAKEASELMIDFVTRLTSAKRHLLEESAASDCAALTAGATIRPKRRQVSAKLAAVPGKLDHATVVAFTVPKIG